MAVSTKNQNQSLVNFYVSNIFFLQSDPSRRHRITPSRSSSKRKSNPYSEAVSLARHLYMLDGYKKSEVAGKLADP